MPPKAVFIEVDEDDIKELEEGGDQAQSTKYRRKSCVKTFTNFVSNYKKISLEELISNALANQEGRNEMENTLKAFFNTMRVKDKLGNWLHPKYNTCASFKSQLKMHLLGETDDKLDIDSRQFAEFRVRFLSFFSDLKISVYNFILFFIFPEILSWISAIQVEEKWTVQHSSSRSPEKSKFYQNPRIGSFPN